MSDLVVQEGVVIPEADLEWTAARSAGPGGQNVNKVATKIQLRFDLNRSSALTAPVKVRLRCSAAKRLDAEGRIVIVSQATRSQTKNLEDARSRLADLIRRALRPPKTRKATKPSAGAKRRRLDDKRRQADKKRSRQGRFDDA